MKFKEREEARAMAYLASSARIDPAIASAMLPAFRSLDLGSDDAEHLPFEAIGLIVAPMCWVIRDDDLPSVHAAVASVLATLGAQAIGESPQGWAPVVGAVGIALWQLAKKGTTLTRAQILVLTALKDRKLSTPPQVVEWIEVKTGISFAREEILTELEQLTKTRLADGSLVPLTSQDHDGNWSAQGV